MNLITQNYTFAGCACGCGTRSRVRVSFYSLALLDYGRWTIHMSYTQTRHVDGSQLPTTVTCRLRLWLWVKCRYLVPHTCAQCQYDRTASVDCDGTQRFHIRSSFKNTQLHISFMCTQHNFTFLIKVFSVINFVAISRNNAVIGVTSKAIDTSHSHSPFLLARKRTKVATNSNKFWICWINFGEWDTDVDRERKRYCEKLFAVRQ